MRQRRAPIAPQIMQCLGGQIVPLATVRIVAKLSLRSSDDRSVLAGEEQTPRLGLEIIPRALENARRVFGEAWILPPQHVAAPPVPHGCDPTAELVQNWGTLIAYPEFVHARSKGPIIVRKRFPGAASSALNAQPRKVVGLAVRGSCSQHRLQ